MEKEAKSIRLETLRMCWHMRGGLTYTESLNLSPQEREAIGQLVKDHMETTKKTGLPYF